MTTQKKHITGKHFPKNSMNPLPHPLLQTQFPLIYKPDNNGLPSSVALYYKYFIQPREVTSSGQFLVINMSPDTPKVNDNSCVKPPSIFIIQ